LDQSAESRWTAAPECKQKADVGTKKQPVKIAVLHEIPTLEIVRAGLHWSFKMSRQMLPLLLIFGWNTLVRNATCILHVSDVNGRNIK
jgi:hypothetical protein